MSSTAGEPRGVQPRDRRPWARAIAILILLLSAIPSLALEAADSAERIPLSQLGLERWDKESGLAGNWVRDIVQGESGHLWVATAGGLSRFDGQRFLNFTPINSPELPGSMISALALRREGGLWIGLAQGGLRLFHRGRIEAAPVPACPGIQAPINALAEDESGILWIGTSEGLWKADGEACEAFTVAGLPRDAEVRVLLVAPDGRLLVRTADHGIWFLDDQGESSMPDPPGCYGTGLALGPRGELVTTCFEGIWRWHPGESAWQQVSQARGTNVVFVDARGDLWFGDPNGLTRLSDDGRELLSPDRGISDWRVRTFFPDDQGNLWVGTFSGGLARLRQGAVRSFGAREGLPIEGTTAVLAARDGKVWIGDHGGGLAQWTPTGGLERVWTTRDGLPSDTVWSLAEDPWEPGRLWVATGQGLARLEDDGAVQTVGDLGFPYGDDIRIVYVDPERRGTIWVAGFDGSPLEIRGDERIVHDRERGLEVQRVRLFHRTRDGRLLVAGSGGLFRKEGDRWLREGPDSEELGSPTAIEELPDGTLWIATDRPSLVRQRGESLSYLLPSDGLPNPGIQSLELDAHGALWMSGNEGLVRFLVDDWQAWQDGLIEAVPFEELTQRDGLRDSECNGWGAPASTRLFDGRLLYPTISGIALVDPALVPDLELRPEEVLVDAAWTGTRSLDLDRPWRLKPYERSLRIRYSAIEFVRPEALAFRFRLAGYDETWRDGGPAQEAFYAHLHPGEFRFRLQARLPGRDWVEVPGETNLVVEPRLWETTWMRATAIVALLVLGLAVTHWRSGLHRAHAAEIERERSFLREVIDTSPDPIFVRNEKGTYSLVNRAAAAIYGVAPRDLEGRSPSELPTLPGMDRIEALDAEVLASGRENQIPEERVVDHEGNEHFFRIVKRPHRDQEGRIREVIGTAVDVSDFKRAELRLRQEEAELLASREEARGLALQLLRAQEDERQRLARELHDDFTQRLAGLAMLAGSAARTAARTRLEEAPRLEDLRIELEKLSNEMQGLSRELHSPALDELGIATSLSSECARFATRTGWTVEFHQRSPVSEPSLEIGLALYRILQEALRNAHRHSGAPGAHVSLAVRSDILILEIRDEGRGFDPLSRPTLQGIGLASMQERARLIGAELRAESSPGQGTTIVVEVPIASEGAGAPP